ncbi:hypothetical protein PC116_g33 [Phytophthora cactorum]|nr:hypothetical protein PC116_g33 [Phytophthora cactorum]
MQLAWKGAGPSIQAEADENVSENVNAPIKLSIPECMVS